MVKKIPTGNKNSYRDSYRSIGLENGEKKFV
jgi:hypothetical protein